MSIRYLVAAVTAVLPLSAQAAEPRENYIADWSDEWVEQVTHGWKLSGQLTVATDSTSKGISETQGNGQIGGAVTATRGWFYASARYKNYKGSDGSDHQSGLAVGGKWKLGQVNLNSQIIYKVNTGARSGSDNDFYEWQTEASRTWGKTTLKGLSIWSPDSSGTTKRAGYYEIGVAQKVASKWTVSGGIGIRRLQPARDYTAFNLGTAYAMTEKTGLDLRYYTTDAKDYSKVHGDRLVLSLTQKF
ncbi:hypothetical protein PQU92_04440 [Asticcacaulis sp. BYS171W]|uniref:Porin domain-containing protein n=1 Tax=Asticcacaulis aquaticus TaxID=2984212 RepID=A0ABT5HR12_9CAUL|nr:hypothetical protein [Asticcacaulis aquaticus]MDC7682511.1 hypothetical protein [Asticcacaulis aquaticus]